MPTKPTRLARTTVYESDYISLHLDKVELPSGKIIEKYHQLEWPAPSVVTVVRNQHKQILMIQAYRYTFDSIEWEIPGGRVDQEEEIVDAAAREVREETGCEVKNIRHIYTYQPHNGMCKSLIHVCAAEVEVETAGEGDTDEVRSKKWMCDDEINELIEKNEFRDGVSLLAVMLERNVSRQ